MALPPIKLAYKTADQYYFRLSLIFYLLAAVPMVPFIVIYLGMQEGDTLPVLGDELNPTITAVLAVLAFANVVLGMRLFKKEIVKLKSLTSLRDRLNLFLQASIVQYSCLEAAIIISVVGLYLTRMTFFVLLFLGMLIIFAQVRPEMRRIAKQLKMTKEEEEIVYQKKEIA
jgi:hypothetical protein